MNPETPVPKTPLASLGWVELPDGHWLHPDGKRQHTLRVALLLASDPSTPGLAAPPLFAPKRRGRPRNPHRHPRG